MRSKKNGRRRLGPIAGILVLSVGLSACEKEAPPIGQEAQDRVVQLAEPVVDELLRTLVTNLTQAMQDGGPVNAIEFCSLEALPLTHSVESGSPGGLELKRTSFRYRNPLNAPDEAEEMALLYFEEATLSGDPVPPSYVQRVSDEEFRYYRPLFLGEACLNCHGARDGLLPEVQAALDAKYPEDLATGYGPGDFRGVVRVSVPASSLEAEAGG